jgi:hypothetical protein
VLVPRPDVLELYARGAVELHRVRDVLTFLADQPYSYAGLLEDLADGRFVGEFVLLYMILNLHTLAGYASIPNCSRASPR